MMKKLLTLVLGLLMLPLMSEASSNSQVITLSPGWNVVSTPAVLSSLEFSNGGDGISFSTLKNGEWKSVQATVNTIKPLDGFLVHNSNNKNVKLTLNFKTNLNPSEVVLQKDLDLGWNLVGITTTNDPLKTISSVLTIDLTKGTTNKVNMNYSNTINPELGEAYFVFVNKKDTVYGGISNLPEEIIVEPEDPIVDPEEPEAGNEELDVAHINSVSTNRSVTWFKFKTNETITGVVLFSNEEALNEPITITDNKSIEVENRNTAQVITAIGYGCPVNLTSIEDCETQILKTEYPDLFKVVGNDIKLFKIK